MLTEPVLEKMKALKLEAMAEAWAAQMKDPSVAKLSFDERIALLIDAEWIHRENKRLARCLKEAKLRLSSACVEGIDYPAKRELDKAVIRQLATGDRRRRRRRARAASRLDASRCALASSDRSRRACKAACC